MAAKRAAPQPLKVILPGVLKRSAKRHQALASIQRRWPSLVGRELARHTKPVSLRRGRLTVHADQPGDSYLFGYERGRVLERLQHISDARVEEIVVRAGQLS